MAERISRYMSKFENADWKTMIGIAVMVPIVGLPTFAAFCGLRARRALRQRFAR